MDGVKYSTPEPFTIPDYDFEAVRNIARATNLENYYANLLDDAFDRSEDDFTYGISPAITKRLLERVRNGFEWKEWKGKMLKMGDHYKIKVSGIEDQGEINVHFIHRKSSKPDAINLLMVHGWPGSFIEFYKIVEILGDSYNIVMPSIPGYAFSDAPKKGARTEGGVPWGYAKSAKCFNAVMMSLGYSTYVTAGGDWGSMLTRFMALSFPDNVKALHLNYFSGARQKPESLSESKLTETEQRGLDRGRAFRQKGSAYQEIQGTAPYTLGGALACSPIATIIYIAEKMYRWSSPDTHPSEDEVIANSLLYYFTGNITSSFWLYYMRRSGPTDESDLLENSKIMQPAGFGCGAYEIHWPARAAFEQQMPNTRQWNVLEKGGHFLALECPETLARDMNKMFKTEEVRKLLGISPQSKI